MGLGKEVVIPLNKELIRNVKKHSEQASVTEDSKSQGSRPKIRLILYAQIDSSLIICEAVST